MQWKLHTLVGCYYTYLNSKFAFLPVVSVEIGLPLRAIAATIGGTIMEGGVGTFGTAIEPMHPNRFLEQSFPTAPANCIVV